MEEPKKKWAISYAITPKQLFINFPVYKYISIAKDLGMVRTIRLCARVFVYFFYLLIIDVIENKVTFKLPPGTKAYIEMTPITGEEFIKARQNGAFQDVDFLVSNFTGYNIILRISNRYKTWKKRIYVSSKFRDRIVELTNKGESW